MVAIVCAAFLIAGAQAAKAGVNVWTTHGPSDGSVRALAIDPTTPSTLYAGTGEGVFDMELTPPPACVGDCNDDGRVAIDDLLALVNIALGDALPAACPSGLPSGATVDVALIIQAVNRAMQGCGPLPWQAGPFGVGVREVTFTKKSVTAPAQDRVLVTDIWYPAARDAGPEDADLGGVVNAPWAAGATHLPLLVFSHGACALPTLSRFFMRAVASYGFIVAAPLHAGDLLTDPTCGPDDRPRANRVPDIELVLDSLLQLNTDATSFFSGAVDPQRIGMSGQSYGGNTALRVATTDARVIAGLAVAPTGQAIRPAAIHVPVMLQSGALDSLFGLTSFLYGGLKPPKYLVEILNTAHDMFTDDGCYSNCCGPSSACTVCFPDLPMPVCDAAGPDALTADAAHQLILRYAVPFLLHWVAGDSRFDAYLAPDAAPLSVIFSVDTGGAATGGSSPAQ